MNEDGVNLPQPAPDEKPKPSQRPPAPPELSTLVERYGLTLDEARERRNQSILELRAWRQERERERQAWEQALDQHLERAFTPKETNPEPPPPKPPPTSPAPAPEPGREPTQRTRGRSPVHEWHMVDGEIARRCHGKDGVLKVPDKENALVDEMLDWYEAELGFHMSTSTMREAVRRVCAQLRKTTVASEKTRPPESPR